MFDCLFSFCFLFLFLFLFLFFFLLITCPWCWWGRKRIKIRQKYNSNQRSELQTKIFKKVGKNQWRSQRAGRGGRPPPGRNSAPSRPHEITLCTEVYGEPPFWVPVSPPAHPWAPLAAPSFWKAWLRPWQKPDTEQVQRPTGGRQWGRVPIWPEPHLGLYKD